MYTVYWRDSLLDHLADLYVTADVPERERIARGVQGLNRRLKDEPYEVGESRDDRFRIAFPPLLAVVFEVDESKQLVRIVSVNRYGR
jgi:hypothetical protein